MDVIRSYFTTGLCGTCYRELPANIEYRSDGAAYITKTCPSHGYHEAMVERSYNFWDNCTQRTPNPTYDVYNNVTLIEATDRCNVQCKHCYHMPDNSIKDKPIDWIVKMADIAPTRTIILSGAEPTVRADLPDIIRQISNLQFLDGQARIVDIYSNGIKLQKAKYVKTLQESGLNSVSMSIHHPDYHDGNIFSNVEKAIDNLIYYNINLGQCGFTVENKEQLNAAVDKMLYLIDNRKEALDFCVRSPARIGWDFEQTEEIFASDIVKWFKEIANERGLKFERHPNYGSNPYHVGYILEGVQNIQVIHWPDVKSVDTSYMYMGPYAMMMPNTFGTFAIQAILRDGVRKGWYQGHRLQGFDDEKLVDFSRLVRPSDVG